MNKLMTAVVAGLMSVAVAGAYAGEMKSDAKSETGMAKSEKGMAKKDDAMSKDDDKKKKAKKKDEMSK